MHARRLLGSAVLAAAASMSAGCGPKPFSISIGPKYDLIGGLTGAVTDVLVREIPASTILPASADAATVVFIRPSDEAPALMPIVVDERGQFLGQSLAASYFAVAVPPGAHLFVLCNDTPAGLRAELAPGKRYVVEITREGSFSRRMVPSAMRPGSEGFAELDTWYAKKKRVVEDGDAGQSYLNAHSALAQGCLRTVQADLAAGDAGVVRARSLAPGDGR
ncbi:hypothetical protein A7982_12893 [Minicystis rosea]|nr:hypothetical protein A7982_12893 [Minicystis rosea]